jgi:hypothetical protein
MFVSVLIERWAFGVGRWAFLMPLCRAVASRLVVVPRLRDEGGLATADQLSTISSAVFQGIWSHAAVRSTYGGLPRGCEPAIADERRL